MHGSDDRESGHPLAALAIAVFSISWAAVLFRLASVVGPVAAWWRLLVGSLATIPFSSRRRIADPGPALAGASLSLHLILWFESLRYTSVAASTGIVVTYPVYLLILEALLGSEHVSLLRVAGALLALAGVAVLAEPWRGGLTLKGGLLALAAALAASAYFYVGRRLRASGMPVGDYTLAAYTWAFIVSTAWCMIGHVDPIHVPLRSVPYLVLLGVVPMLGGHTMLNYALRFYPASTVTTVALLEPFGATALALVMLGEEPPAATIPGLLLAVGGSAFAILGGKPSKENNEARVGYHPS